MPYQAGHSQNVRALLSTLTPSSFFIIIFIVVIVSSITTTTTTINTLLKSHLLTECPN
jgi:hypothetical protein